MEREKRANNRENHIQNKKIFTGFYHGRYIIEGKGQPTRRKDRATGEILVFSSKK